jgi:hydrogenase expression/formation protein HypC
MCLAIPGQVVRLLEAELPMADVAFGSIVKPICLALVPDAAVGDFVLAHVGFAVAKLDEAEAERTRALLGELGDLSALDRAKEASK